MPAEGAARHAMPKGRPVGWRALKNPGQDFDTPRYHPAIYSETGEWEYDFRG